MTPGSAGSSCGSRRAGAGSPAAATAGRRGGGGQSERNSLRSAGIDPKTGRPIPGGKLDPKRAGKKGGPTGSQYLNWQTSIEDIASAAKRLRTRRTGTAVR
jgi:hypothetical protein